MLNLRFLKWLLLLSFFVCLCTYTKYYTDGQQSSLVIKVTPKCEESQTNGLNCDASKLQTTKKINPKPKKKEVKKKLAKVPHMEKSHILPTHTITNQDQNQAHKFDANSQNSEYLSYNTNKVLIISYFDIGSPQIGDILNHHPDIFYFNEPLYPYDSTSLKDGEEPISRRFISEATDFLSDLFDCKILDSKLGYSDPVTKRMAKRAYNSCNEQQGNVTECVEETCKSKRVVLSKTIRIYIQDIQPFLMRNRGRVKVILLQRDPRVNLHLRNRKGHPGGFASGSDMFFQGRSLCSRMLHDVLNARRLEGSGHGDFYRIVLYEHFLKNPETILKGILSFLGLSSQMDAVKKLLRSANAYKYLQKAKLNRWEWIPDDEEALSVDKACKFFYKNSLYNPMFQSPGMVQRYNLCQFCD